MVWELTLLYRIAALGLAFGAGYGVGWAVPSWRGDTFKEGELLPDMEIPFTARGGLAPLGCLLLPEQLAFIRVSGSQLAVIQVVLLLLALYSAARGWPPLWLNPFKSHPLEFICVTLFQRWIWYTLAALTLGILLGGALALKRRNWF